MLLKTLITTGLQENLQADTTLRIKANLGAAQEEHEDTKLLRVPAGYAQVRSTSPALFAMSVLCRLLQLQHIVVFQFVCPIF